MTTASDMVKYAIRGHAERSLRTLNGEVLKLVELVKTRVVETDEKMSRQLSSF